MCCLGLYWHVGFCVGKVKTSLAFLSEKTGFEMLFDDMLAVNGFLAILVCHAGPSNFYSFHRCKISTLYFFPA